MPAVHTRARTGPASHTGRSWQRKLHAVWAAALAGLCGVLFAGLTAMTVTLWATDASYTQTNPVVDLAFFALGGIVVTVGFASQIRTPRIAGVQQTLLALAALSVVGGLGGRIEPLVGPLVLLAAAAPLVVLHPDRRLLLAAGAGVSKPLVALAVAAAAPAVAYAAGMLKYARAAGPSCFLGQCVQGDRYAEAAALAAAIVLLALLAALRTPGWRLPAWSAGASGVVLGVASLAFPGQVGALEVTWAVAAVAWGGGVITIARRHRLPPTRPATA